VNRLAEEPEVTAQALVMTDQDMLTIAVVGVLAVWWLVKHPEAAKGIGLVPFVGLQ
jgi:hypothetical protein